MKTEVFLAPLLFLSTLFKGVCLRAWRKPMYVMEGEMVVLQCPLLRSHNHGDAKPTWTSHSALEMNLTNNVLSEERQMLIHGGNLVILNASVNHQGNYSCSLGNASSHTWTLSVFRQDPQMTLYTYRCHQEQSCTLKCPAVLNIPRLTNPSTTWRKDSGSLPTSFKDGYFGSVDEKDHGVYTCTRSYLYHGRLYNMTSIMALDVLNDKEPGQRPVIISPKAGEVFHVELDSPVVINCKADLYDDFDEVYWLNGNSLVDRNENLPVYYNTTQERSGGQIKTTASLVFRKVSEKDLLNRYTCKLESPSLFSNVTISLAQMTRPFSLSVFLGIVGFIMVMVVALSIIYVRLKIDIALFLRDSLGCYGSTSDGKSYDAYLMCYKSDTEAGLNEDDRRWLEKVLEEEFGYNLCIYDRDVLPGEAVADAVLGCIEQSRRVVLIPSSPDPGTGSGLLSAIHTALVERQTGLVLIKPETTVAPRSEPRPHSSLPESLQLFGKAGHSVTWKGPSSQPLSSSFWKHLRYHLPAPQRPKPLVIPTDNYLVC